MADFFTAENLITLVILTTLETVLGFDNLLYISIEAKRVAPEQQARVRHPLQDRTRQCRVPIALLSSDTGRVR